MGTLEIYCFRTLIVANMSSINPTPSQFYKHKDQIRYINGRSEVYETNIVDPAKVLFLPDGRQRGNHVWEPVLFRKLHKVEWLFE